MRKVLLICFISISLLSFSQSENDNFEKYWRYRYRLLDQFMPFKPGLPSYVDNCVSVTDISKLNFQYYYTQGFSAPANTRYSNDDIKNDKNITNTIGWGDAPIHLGWYIGVLATEYKILSNKGEPTDKIKQELYYAMMAYERIDREAEHTTPAFWNDRTSDCDLNGFFMRDDLNENWVNTSSRNKFSSSDYNSTLNNNPVVAHHAQNDGSYDHRAHLLIGMSLVKKCFEDNKNESYNGYNFYNKALQYTDLMISYIKNSTLNDDGGYYGLLDPTSPGFYTVNNDDKQDPDGFESQLTSYGFAQAGKYITGNDNYSTNYSSTFGFNAWNASAAAYSLGIGPEFSINYNCALAAIGSSFSCGVTSTKISHCLIFDFACVDAYCIQPSCAIDISFAPISAVLGGLDYLGLLFLDDHGCATGAFSPVAINVDIDVTGYTLNAISNTMYNEIYAELHKYLHVSDQDLNSSEYLNLIMNKAPYSGPLWYSGTAKTTGNFNGVYGDLGGSIGWLVSNRWEKSLSAQFGQFDDNGNPNFQGQYNGLDYMLFYNLYQLNYGIPSISNFNRLDCNFDGQTLSGTETYYCYQSATINNSSLASNANITIKSVENIDITGTFDTNNGTIDLLIDYDYLNPHTPNTNLRVASSDSNATASIASPLIQAPPKNTLPVNSGYNPHSKKVLSLDHTDNKSKNDTSIFKENFKSYVKPLLDQKIKSFSINSDSIKEKHKYIPQSEYLAKLSKGGSESLISPNPAKENAAIEFQIPYSQNVDIKIMDLRGNVIYIPSMNKYFNSGYNKADIDVSSLAPGTYVYTIQTTSYKETKKFVKL